MNSVTVTSLTNLQNEVRYGDGQTFVIDEPQSVGGNGAGPDPFSLLLSALGGCISMTVTMYARRKSWPLERVIVTLQHERIHAKDCAECEQDQDAFIHRIQRTMELEGPLTAEQKTRLLEIAHKCPVHKTLSSQIVITDK